MKKRVGTILTALWLVNACTLSADTFLVEHLHLRGGCKGKLVFSDTGIEFTADKKAHGRIWVFQDIQQLELAPLNITILTYDRRKARLGADHVFRFRLLSGTVTEQLQQQVRGKLSRPLVSSILPQQENVQFSIPARHRLFLGGAQGVLEFGSDIVVYRSMSSKDSRIWRYDELLSIASTGPFQLRIGVLEKTGGEYGEEKNYVFDLKRRLDPSQYDFLWNRINRGRTEVK